ncbi:patatin-like phospholipase family protein [Verrucomicrobiales bacterium]|nr:patatin-like phospholipase family protein [Verrucomicrobiales bacterium]
MHQVPVFLGDSTYPSIKRLLPLDGGGIRGIFSIGVFKRVEEFLRERYRCENAGFVLKDYFDFVGGTSTSAIIAALLSKGQSVRSIREAYEQLGLIIFRRKPFWCSWRSFNGSEDFAQV